MSQESQATAILSHLRSGQSLTPLQAINCYGCIRLSGRILELRQAGHDIETNMIEVGDGKRVASYILKEIK